MSNILKELGLEKPANINNTNNNNNTNNTNNKLTTTTHVWSQDHSNETSSKTASLPLGESMCSQKKVTEKLPPEWKGVKCDLYINGYNRSGSPSMKLNIGVIRRIDGAAVPLQASLNSSWDDGVRRGVDKTAWNTDSHWIRCKQHRKELNYLYDDVRCSKIGLKQKAGGTTMVAFVYKDLGGVWCVDIMREGQLHTILLNRPLSDAQIEQGNMIATGYAGERSRGLITPKELGI